MKNIKLFGIFLVLAMLITGCSSNTDVKEDAAVDDHEQKEAPSEDKENSSTEKETTTHDEYPLPILSGWEEIEIEFETIGNGSIDVWHGEFSFDGEIDDYFELYQTALIDMGFEETVTQDDEGMKTLEMKKVIDGDEHVGNAQFNDHWVKASLQHFK